MICERIGPICRHCQKDMAEGDVRECAVRGVPPPPPDVNHILSSDERRELFGDEDPTLLGNRFKALTDRLGFPPCAGCDDRQEWFNRAHALLRSGLESLRETISGL